MLADANPLPRAVGNPSVLRTIDEGNEEWISPSRLPKIEGGRWRSEIDYITFLPDFFPPTLVRWLLPIEHRLESSRRLKRYSVYMAVFEASTEIAQTCLLQDRAFFQEGAYFRKVRK